MEEVTVLQLEVITWGGMKLHHVAKEGQYKSRGRPFEWEVDDHIDDDGEYEARVYFKGVKIASGEGKTRPAALTQALQRLSSLESSIATEMHARKDGNRTYKRQRGD